MVRTEQDFRPDNITMILMWSQEIHDNFQIPVSYRVSVLPMMKATLTMVTSTWVNITLLYNILYNVSVVADFCGQRNTTMLVGIYYSKYLIILKWNIVQDPNAKVISAHLNLLYYTSIFLTVNCGAPFDELASSMMVMGYNGVALEGDSVSFTCSSGDVLTGPNSSICTGNGKWEPDPRISACHKNHHHNNNICRSKVA